MMNELLHKDKVQRIEVCHSQAHSYVGKPKARVCDPEHPFRHHNFFAESHYGAQGILTTSDADVSVSKA